MELIQTTVCLCLYVCLSVCVCVCVLLSTHADRQGVDISFTFFVHVCTVMDLG